MRSFLFPILAHPPNRNKKKFFPVSQSYTQSYTYSFAIAFGYSFKHLPNAVYLFCFPNKSQSPLSWLRLIFGQILNGSVLFRSQCNRVLCINDSTAFSLFRYDKKGVCFSKQTPLLPSSIFSACSRRHWFQRHFLCETSPYLNQVHRILFMIRLFSIDFLCAVYLLQQNDPHHLMRERHRRKTQQKICSL